MDLTEAGFEAPRDGDLEHALTHLTDALEADNTDTRARKGLAAVSLEMGDKAAAVTAASCTLGRNWSSSDGTARILSC